MIHRHLTGLHLAYLSQAATIPPLFLSSSLPLLLPLSLGLLHLCVWLCLSFYSPQNSHTPLIHSYYSADITNFHYNFMYNRNKIKELGIITFLESVCDTLNN